MPRENLITPILALIPILIGIAPLAASEVTPPFVAAFERFARHDEMDTVEAGKLLVSELSCTACHATSNQSLAPKRGPRLNNIGNRVQLNWLTEFLTDPGRVKPGTTMPDMLGNLPASRRKTAVDALAAYLQKLHQPFPEIKGTGARPVPNEFWKHGDVNEGRQLFHQIGCVACHEMDETYETVSAKPSPLDELIDQLDPEELKEAGLWSAARRVESVPLGDPAAKYNRQSLSHFLLNPHGVRPGGRMPNFQLSVVEAADIAAWLLRAQDASAATEGQPPVSTPSEQLVAQGRLLFNELGCAACHDDKSTPRQEWKLADLDADSNKGCITGSESELPSYPLDETQRTAIRTALTSLKDTPPLSATSHLQAILWQLNCQACHERNQLGGIGRFRKPCFETKGHVDIGDEGRLPPPLTGVGRKLRSPWISKVLSGRGHVRNHMQVRMPVFSTTATQVIPALLAEADKADSRSEEEIFGPLKDLSEPGRQLLNTGCVQCHPLRGEALPGVVGVDLQGISGRVHPSWFQDFLLDPGSLKPHTRMPSFFPGGRSQNQEILDGNTADQLAAMWAYLKGIGTARLPDRIERARSQNYELQPMDHPVLLRTFMKQAGTHAIAVGYPEQVHFAFDANRILPAQAWRGRFLDAQGTWFVRFAPEAVPLGTDIVSLPTGFPFAFLSNPEAPWPVSTADTERHDIRTKQFLGYRLSSDGIPEFLYRVGPFDVTDRIIPADKQQLDRQVVLTRRQNAGAADQLWFRAHVGPQLELTQDGAYTDTHGLQVSVDNNFEGVLRVQESGMEWIMPAGRQGTQTLEVHYRW